MSNNELQHHGILGMKWGIRRYQNPDGTLTSAGKERLVSRGQASKNARKAYSKSLKDTKGSGMSKSQRRRLARAEAAQSKVNDVKKNINIREKGKAFNSNLRPTQKKALAVGAGLGAAQATNQVFKAWFAEGLMGDAIKFPASQIAKASAISAGKAFVIGTVATASAAAIIKQAKKGMSENKS